MGLVKKYLNKDFEERVLYIARYTLTISILINISKFVFGLLTGARLLALFGLVLVLAKTFCAISIKTQKKNPWLLIASMLTFISGYTYAAYNVMLYLNPELYPSYSFVLSIVYAGFGFADLGIAIYGLFKVKGKTYRLRCLKMLSLGNALIVIHNTQLVLLSMNEAKAPFYDLLSALVVAFILILLSFYILFSDHIGIHGREKISFINLNVNKDLMNIDYVISKSYMHGNYRYVANENNGILTGEIRKDESLFKRMHPILKVICIILSEILIFVYAIGYFIRQLRCIDPIHRLRKQMAEKGYLQINEIEKDS